MPLLKKKKKKTSFNGNGGGINNTIYPIARIFATRFVQYRQCVHVLQRPTVEQFCEFLKTSLVARTKRIL